MLAKYTAAEAVDFTERDGLHAGPFKAERETADAREQVEDFVSGSERQSVLSRADACCVEQIDDMH